ncbi:MAG: o-succinylbenzoate synthase [Crocinitomicaceae bacterium]|jgi:o-succinylbenzoate synthase|nr:o-succinylbenzoate synthase [Crocinitomicaceae bacterium]
MKVSFHHTVFDFKQPSGTSRGVLIEKHAWFLHLEENGQKGIGECSIIPKLSPDFMDIADYEARLDKLVRVLELKNLGKKDVFEFIEDLPLPTFLEENPSIHFGLEMALLDLQTGGKRSFFSNAFEKGEVEIPINGLIWMGDYSFMRKQVHELKEKGFTCVKMKIGAIDKKDELAIMGEVRSVFPPETIFRLDANGAFAPEEALNYFDEIKHFNIHSVEQPIKQGQWEAMAQLVKDSPIPIALDEELIGVPTTQMEALLDAIHPHYIILKPSLHGGIVGSKRWIELAESKKIDWWMTSALESNIGLDCIAQLTAEYPLNKHHGLGTGSLYVNNIPSDLEVKNGYLKRSI